TFSFGGRLTALARGRRGQPVPATDTAVMVPDGNRPSGAIHEVHVPLWTLPLQLLIATYGGYFGGGMGIMMLAAMAVAGMTDMHEMNGLKSVLASAINAVALATFIIERKVVWRTGLIMIAGGVLGGYFAAAGARKVA